MTLRNRLAAMLAHDAEDMADPQARDRERDDVYGTAVGGDTHDTVEAPDGIEDWVDAYFESPLLRAPTRKFARDVLAPGYRIAVPDNESVEDALREWASSAAIVDGEFDHDLAELLFDAVCDKYGRRGTALVEHVYDDAADQNRLMALRLFRAETTTTYTRPGKNILIRPDDDVGDYDDDDDRASRFDVARPTTDLDSSDRSDIPQTPAGEHAAYVQYDDVFGARERNEVPLAQSQVTKLTHGTDTGSIFGQPPTAEVAGRAQAIEDKLDDLDQGIKAKAYKYWLVKLPGVSQSKAEGLVKDLNLDDPTTKSTMNSQEAEIESVDGDVPDIVDHLQFDVEYVLSAGPVPLYKTGFAGNINRDVTGEQGDDYEEDVIDARRTLEARFGPILEAKAAELAGGDDPDIDVEFEIRPAEAASPLDDDTFDADAFKSVMAGLKQAAPGGAVEQVVDPETVVETFLGLDPDEAMADSGGGVPLPDEADPAVQDAMATAYEGYEPADADD